MMITATGYAIAIALLLNHVGNFIYHYQTLITGVMAIVAAYIATRPVWKQLSLMQTQSNGVLREMLLQRQVDLEQASLAIVKNVDEPLRNLARIYWYEEIKIDEEQAFYHDQTISRAVRWLRLEYKWRDAPEVEAARSELISKIDKMIGILEDIHGPAHTQQYDEDHNISDEDWAAFLARGETAVDEVEGALAHTRQALDAVQDALSAEVEAIRIRLGKLDRALLAEA